MIPATTFAISVAAGADSAEADSLVEVQAEVGKQNFYFSVKTHSQKHKEQRNDSSLRCFYFKTKPKHLINQRFAFR